jgi:hypothetical protein
MGMVASEATKKGRAKALFYRTLSFEENRKAGPAQSPERINNSVRNPPCMVEKRHSVVFVQLAIICPKRGRATLAVHTLCIQTIFHLIKQNVRCCVAVNTQFPQKNGEFGGFGRVSTAWRRGMSGLMLRCTKSRQRPFCAN